MKLKVQVLQIQSSIQSNHCNTVNSKENRPTMTVISQCEGQRVNVYKDYEKSKTHKCLISFTSCLCLLFILFSHSMIFVIRLLHSISYHPFLFLSYKRHGQYKMNESGLWSSNGELSVAYIQFMSNYGCQCGKEIGGGIHLSFGLIFYLLHGPLFISPIQVITAHLNA